jgi:hypothetical protein
LSPNGRNIKFLMAQLPLNNFLSGIAIMLIVLQTGCQCDENARKIFEFSQCLVARQNRCGVQPRIGKSPPAAGRSTRTTGEKSGGKRGTVERGRLPEPNQNRGRQGHWLFRV